MGVVYLARHCQGRRNMVAQVIQVEIRTGTTHTVTWLDAALKPKRGMALVCKDDPRPWTVVHAYSIAEREVKDINVGWKVASCEAPTCVA
jgi:hypothetical protein